MDDEMIENPERVIVAAVEIAIGEGYDVAVGVGRGLERLRKADWELAWFEEDSDMPLRRWTGG